MPYLDKRKIYFFTGLLAVTILFSIYNLYLTEYSYFVATSQKTRHIIRFVSILLAWGIGELAFRNYMPGWLIQIWRLLYVSIGLALLFIGVYNWYSGALAPGIRNIAMTLNVFLISPAPFVIAWIINKTTNWTETTNRTETSSQGTE